MVKQIKEQLALQWSSEQIQGRLKSEGDLCVCPQTIYAFIAQDKTKGQPLDKVTKQQVVNIQTRLNQRPRKLLGYKSPEEVYEEMKLAS